MSKLRVLTISKPYVAAAYRQKFRYLAEDPRFEVGLITGRSWAGQKFEALADQTYWLRTLDIALNGKNHFHYYQGLRQAMAEFKPDIVNIEEEHYSFVTFQAIRAAKAMGAKCLFYTWQNINKKYPPPFSMIESYVFRNSSYAVTGNQEALAILRLKGYQGKGAVIPQMGADAEAIANAQKNQDRFRSEIVTRLGLSGKSLILAFAGRFVEEKGIQDVIEALAQLKKDQPDIHLLLLGDGPYKAQLLARAEQLQVQSQVHLIGSVPSLSVYSYIGIADALVLSSHTRENWKEQFGRVLVEAMLSGTVPIGSDSGEIPFVIGEAGLIHKEQNIEDIARCIGLLDRDRALLERLALAAKVRAGEHYTNQIIAKKFATIFLEIAGQVR